MERVLITGIGGFVGRHLTAQLLRSGLSVLGFDRSGESHRTMALETATPGGGAGGAVETLSCDLADAGSVRSLFADHRFDAIVHLAGISFPPIGWKDPLAVLEANTRNTVVLLQAARERGWKGRFLFVSSSDVYGKVARERQPIAEEAPPNPDNPYGASKAAAELFAACLGGQGIEVMVARPFNHIGPGQHPDFVLPAFLRRIAECRAQGKDVIETGDLTSARDFTDVRDVVVAYELLLRSGNPGTTYNICSGTLTTVGELLETAMRVLGVKLSVQTSAELLRPDGTTIRYGSAARLRALGWSPSFSLLDTVRDTARSLNLETVP